MAHATMPCMAVHDDDMFSHRAHWCSGHAEQAQLDQAATTKPTNQFTLVIVISYLLCSRMCVPRLAGMHPPL